MPIKMANYEVKLKDGNDYLFPQATLCGIDTSNTLATFSSGQINYTATQDCWGQFGYFGDNNANLYLDGNLIAKKNGSIQWPYIQLFIKKGQTVTTQYWATSYSLPNKIFGIKR